jgi:hypothetical protein
VGFAANALRERFAIEGARLSHRQNTESMQRIHVSPTLGKRRIETATSWRVLHRYMAQCIPSAPPGGQA